MIKINYSVLGFILVGVSLFSKWIDFPLTRDIIGLNFPILKGPEYSHDFPSLSYGLAAGLFLLGSFIAWIQSRPRPFFWGIAGLVFLILMAPLQLAFQSPEWLHLLVSENQQYVKISTFSSTYLPPNWGIEPTFWPHLETQTVGDRLVTAWYFLGIGWYLSISGGLILLVMSIAGIPHPKIRQQSLLQITLIYGLFLGIFFMKPLIAEWHIKQALLLQTQGQPVTAISHLTKAMQQNLWHRLQPEVPRLMGELYAGLGLTDRAEYHLFKGYIYEFQGLNSSAIFEYSRLAMDENLSKIGRQEAARVLVSQGLKWREEAEFTSGILAWQQAFEQDPMQIQALYYIARTHYDLALYEYSLETNQQLINRINNGQILAHLYANMGDCYQKLRRYDEARHYYLRSSKSDNYQNLRSVMSLAGN